MLEFHSKLLPSLIHIMQSERPFPAPRREDSFAAVDFRDRGLLQDWFFRSAVLVGLLLLSGITIPIVGVVYGLDFIAPLAVIGFFVFDRLMLSRLRRYDRALLVGLAFVVSSLALDLVNHAGYQYIFRGIGENFGCYVTFVLGLCVLTRFGLKGFYAVFIITSLSVPLWMLWARDPMIFSLVNLFKFYNGMFIIIPVMYLARRSKVLIGVILLAYAVFLFTICDFRSGAAMAVGSAAWVLGFPVLARIRPAVIAVVILVTLPVGTTLFLAYSYNQQLDNMDVERARRGEMSNAARYDMAVDAVGRIEARPWLGYGSWQHVLLYDAAAVGGNGDVMVGVHNLLLQLGVEYGLAGLLIALGIGLVMLRVLSRLAYYGYALGGIEPGMLAIITYTLLFATDGYVFGGIMGFSRFYLGFQYALLIWCDRLFADMARDRRSGGFRRGRPRAPVGPLQLTEGESSVSG
jgi:hypothetical protein